MRTRFAAPVYAAALAALVCGATGALAQEKTFDLKISHWVPPSHPLQKALEDWGSSVEKDFRRHDQDHDLSRAAARQGLRPLQHGARRHRRHCARQSGLRAWSLSGLGRGRNSPFLVANAKEGSAALDAWYRKYVEREMKEVKYCLAFVVDPGTWHTSKKKIVEPGDVDGMKIRPAQRDDRALGHSTRRHRCSVLGAGNARDYGEGCCRRAGIQLGIARSVRCRQGDEVSHGSCALRCRTCFRS